MKQVIIKHCTVIAAFYLAHSIKFFPICTGIIHYINLNTNRCKQNIGISKLKLLLSSNMCSDTIKEMVLAVKD